MRQLATIRKIKDIQPIDGADKIELCQVDGWQVVAEKGLHQVNDKVIYCEIDSFLPIKPEFEFLRKSSYKKMTDGTEGFRLKTIRLRGKLSQGLVLPLKALSAANIELLDHSGYTLIEEGKDVTELLGITKYEPPVPAQLAGKVKGMFPSFIKKTDQERIQNLQNYIDQYHVEFEVTEKLDGSSCTYYSNDGEFGVCSRNLDLIETEGNTLWRMAKILKIEEYIAGRNIAIQGEMIGEGIQGNPYKLKGQKFIVFDIWDIDHQRYFTSKQRLDFIKPTFMDHVPLLSTFQMSPVTTIEDILKMAEGKSLLNCLVEREGLVFKSLDYVGSQTISFKAINNLYLLGEK